MMASNSGAQNPVQNTEFEAMTKGMAPVSSTDLKPKRLVGKRGLLSHANDPDFKNTTEVRLGPTVVCVQVGEELVFGGD
jgi:hypothetical protein